MIRVPRDDAKRGGGGGGRGRGRANWLARSESGRRNNPAQPAELRDEKKETKAVESSMSKLQLDDDTPTSKKKRYRESKKCHSQNVKSPNSCNLSESLSHRRSHDPGTQRRRQARRRRRRQRQRQGQFARAIRIRAGEEL
ncbi:hypothetical protein C1H46_038835 [Malus baccata]|uniref:Uncharacterized protein n=1 Tax=Malus baccata TaxID=106549 RepID=A0A540KN51_MALBA|nr:hypothetical protein C1H46_038835 [Malus baccata]